MCVFLYPEGRYRLNVKNKTTNLRLFLKTLFLRSVATQRSSVNSRRKNILEVKENSWGVKILIFVKEEEKTPLKK